MLESLNSTDVALITMFISVCTKLCFGYAELSSTACRSVDDYLIKSNLLAAHYLVNAFVYPKKITITKKEK